jgi:hypothetical protein
MRERERYKFEMVHVSILRTFLFRGFAHLVPAKLKPLLTEPKLNPFYLTELSSIFCEI